jgi:hypothetical protein
LELTAKANAASLACCHGFTVAAGDEPFGLVETPIFSGTSLEPDLLLVRTLGGVPGAFAAVAVADVSAVDDARRTITLRGTRDEVLHGLERVPDAAYRHQPLR